MIQHPYPEQPRRIPAQDRVVLRPPEPEVSTTQPWQDDLLDRSELGRDLTEKIRNEKSISVSLHGGWGTGKTFFLKRWQQDMENQGKRVVYFNAWENDFADDPIATLTSILAEQLKGSKFHRLARAAAWAAIHCATQAASDLVKSQTGTSIPFLQFLQRNKTTPDKFTERKQALGKLKNQLERLSAGVREKTDFPLVFIIDELDRCRPDFAVSLLERVKHVLSVQDTVFVFGVNRVSLGEAISARHGISDTDGYLRRFFDLELNIPLPSEYSMVLFAGRRANREHRLEASQEEITEDIAARNWSHQMRYTQLPMHSLCSALGMSLRDTEHCTRTLALAGKNLEPGMPVYPQALGVMTVLKATNPELYDRFAHKRCSAGEVMDHFDRMGYPNGEGEAVVRAEAALYAADGRGREPPALAELRLLAAGQPPNRPELLSARTREGRDQQRLQVLVNQTESLSQNWRSSISFPNMNIPLYLCTLTGLHPRPWQREAGDDGQADQDC